MSCVPESCEYVAELKLENARLTLDNFELSEEIEDMGSNKIQMLCMSETIEKYKKEIEQLKEKLRESDNMCAHLARHIKEMGK